MYKINLHAHSIFSDGSNSPFNMAIEARYLGFSALVLTDHFYGKPAPSHVNTHYRLSCLEKACREAKRIIPIINGIELSFGLEEMLVFGQAMIQEIVRHVVDNEFELTLELLLDWKKKHNSAFILCHPQETENWRFLHPLLDGFERYNGGDDMFPNRDFDCLGDLPGWNNSDAHQIESLERAYNLVDCKIENESQLIKYIRKGKQPTFYFKGEGQ